MSASKKGQGRGAAAAISRSAPPPVNPPAANPVAGNLTVDNGSSVTAYEPATVSGNPSSFPAGHLTGRQPATITDKHEGHSYQLRSQDIHNLPPCATKPGKSDTPPPARPRLKSPTFDQGAGQTQTAADPLQASGSGSKPGGQGRTGLGSASGQEAAGSGLPIDEKSSHTLDNAAQLGEGVVRCAIGFWGRHKLLMSYVTLTSLAFMAGSILTYWRVGPQHVEYLAETSATRAVKKLQEEHVLANVTHDYFQDNNTVSTISRRLVPFIIPALPHHVTNITNVTKVTRVKHVEYMCLQEEAMLWIMMEKKIQELEMELQTNYKNKFDDKMNTIRVELDQHFSNTERTVQNIMQTAEESLTKTMDGKFVKEKEEREIMIKRETQGLNDKQAEFDTRLAIDSQVKENQGFMKIDTFGPVLMILGVLDVLLILGLGLLSVRVVSPSAASLPASRQDGVAPVPNGDAPQAEVGHHGIVAAAPVLVSTNNSNVTCLSFRDDDEELSESLGRKLLNQCSNQRMRLQTFVINSMSDIDDIPACRAALVFVDPDEREMIIEDERYHIGQGLRRHTVKRLRESGVEVFIIIFNDRNSVNLLSGQLYNRKLGQIQVHAQLKRLKGSNRVFSIKDDLHDHQASLIISELNSIFN